MLLRSVSRREGTLVLRVWLKFVGIGRNRDPVGVGSGLGRGRSGLVSGQGSSGLVSSQDWSGLVGTGRDWSGLLRICRDWERSDKVCVFGQCPGGWCDAAAPDILLSPFRWCGQQWSRISPRAAPRSTGAGMSAFALAWAQEAPSGDRGSAVGRQTTNCGRILPRCIKKLSRAAARAR